MNLVFSVLKLFDELVDSEERVPYLTPKIV